MKRWWWCGSLLFALGCGSFDDALKTYCQGELNCQQIDGAVCTRPAECLSNVCVAGHCGQPAYECRGSAPALVAMSTEGDKLSLIRVQLQPGWEQNPDGKLTEAQSPLSSPDFRSSRPVRTYLSPTESTAYIAGVTKSNGSDVAVLGRVLLAPNNPEKVDSTVNFPAAFLPQAIFAPNVNTVIALGPVTSRRIALDEVSKGWTPLSGDDRLGDPRELVTFNEEMGRIVTFNSKTRAVTVSRLSPQNEVMENPLTFLPDALGQGEAIDVATASSIGLLRQDEKASVYGVWLMDLQFASAAGKGELARVKLQDLPARDAEPFKPYRVVGLPSHAFAAFYFANQQHYLVVVAANGRKGTLSFDVAASKTATPLDFFLHCP